MKVLILWNTAGAFTPIAKHLNANGHKARIVMREEFDIYRHSKDSGCAVMVDSAKGFYAEGLKQIIYKFRPDIIHCSSSMKMLVIARAIAPRTPIILSYHGSDIRFAPRRHAVAELADFVHVTTPDLQQYGTWIDRVVDDYFYDRGGRKPNTALMYYSPHYYVDTRRAAMKWCAERGITLTVIDRTDPDFEPIPNKDMPAIYSAHEYYLDWKGQKDKIDALSRSALEALACGCKVVHDSDLEKIISAEEYQLARSEVYEELYESLDKMTYWKAIKRYPRVLSGLLDWARGRVEHYGGV